MVLGAEARYSQNSHTRGVECLHSPATRKICLRMLRFALFEAQRIQGWDTNALFLGLNHSA